MGLVEPGLTGKEADEESGLLRRSRLKERVGSASVERFWAIPGLSYGKCAARGQQARIARVGADGCSSSSIHGGEQPTSMER